MYRTGFRKLTFVLLILAVLTDLWDIRFVSKKSMSAIEAARFIAANPMPVVALSQPWAYGEHLYLGNQIRIVELPMPPRANDISQLPKAVFYVGIYERDLKADAGLISALRDRGFVEVHGWQISRSKPVVLFRRK